MHNMPKQRGCLVPLLAIFAFLIFFMIMVSKGVEDVNEHPEKYDDSSVQEDKKTLIEETLDVSPEQSKQIEEILKQCGIENVINIKHDSTLDGAHKDKDTGYRIACEKADNIILCLNPSKKVCRIGYSGHPLYKQKKVVATLDDYTFTSEELAKYQTRCINVVMEILRSPSTAKYANYSDWRFSKKKKKIIIQSYVDSQNAFGAEIRSDFQIIIKRKDDSISSFIFDGEELIK